jgi:hypothetical protein
MNALLSVRKISAASILAFFVWTNSSNARVLAQGTETGIDHSRSAKPAWLEGTGKDLRVKLSGSLRDETGAPAKNCKLTATLKTQFARRNLTALIKGNLFQVWIPVAADHWYTVHLDATSADGRRSGSKQISNFQLREAAIDGIELIVKPPERFVDVAVVEQGSRVRDAHVVADVTGERYSAKTDGNGIARFSLMNRDKLSALTAWTDDFKIGGYGFNRKPPRDPSGAKFTLELEKCRPQVIRIINEENKTSVSDLRFALTVMTGPPDYQYFLGSPGRELSTNAKGEAVCKWFPNWKTHASYVEIQDPQWAQMGTEKAVDGAILVKVKRSRFNARKRVTGHISSAQRNLAGFLVELYSFQGEEEHRSDMLYAFTDEQGAFTADVLPGATYCVFVMDARYVSNIIDLIPYDPATKKVEPPSLTVSEGRPVEILVNSGPAKVPVPYQSVYLTTHHEFSWSQNGMTRHGRAGRAWNVMTDERGIARSFALAGTKIEAAIFNPEWRCQVSADVNMDGVTRLELHRNVDVARKVRGRLVAPSDVAANLSEALLEIGSVDGETEERFTAKADEKGEFSFESKAVRLGIYAHTKDSKAAGVTFVEDFDQLCELKLQPTGEFHGRLLGTQDRPLNGRAVRSEVYVAKRLNVPLAFSSSFLAATFTSRTDENGNYSFSGLPCGIRISLTTDSVDGSEERKYLEEVSLVPHESRPPMVTKLWHPNRKVTFGERYDTTLRDCRLSNFGAMVILFRPAGEMKQFVDTNFMNHQTTRDVGAFMQIQALLAGESEAEIAKIAQAKNWPLPKPGKVVAIAMDPAGREVGRIEITAKDPAARKLAADFIRRYAPAASDAQHKWDEAFATARKSGRRVWVRVSQRYCGPCFSLARWLDDQKELLEQDYAYLKIDNVRDIHGKDVAERLGAKEGDGVPFFAIFDSDGTMRINSDDPVAGNIGCPSGVEGKRHLRKMLLTTRKRLTEQQIDQIVKTLSD